MADKAVIVVTGGSGLVGSAIRDLVSAQPQPNQTWHFLSSKDGDLADLAATQAIFQRLQPTHVIHLAAKVGGLYAHLRGNLDFLRTNIAINDNVLVCAQQSGARKVISLFSYLRYLAPRSPPHQRFFLSSSLCLCEL